MCCGTPIVGIDAGGTKETVPEPYGLYSNTTNVDVLCNLISLQLNSHFVRDDIARMGKRLYDNATMYESYLSLYSSDIE